MSDSSEVIAYDDQMYVVEEIRNKRMVGGKPQYLVKWLHWDEPQDMTWEPMENLQTVKDLIELFQNKQGSTGVSLKKAEHKKPRQPATSKKLITKEKNPIKQTDKKEKREKRKKREKRQKRLRHSRQEKQQISQREQSEQQNESEPQMAAKTQQNPQMTPQHDSSCSLQQIPEPSLQVGNKCIMYEVDMMNKMGDCVGVKLLPAEEILKNYRTLALEFLENYVVDQDRWRRMAM